MNRLRAVSVGVKSRVPFGIEGLLIVDALLVRGLSLSHFDSIDDEQDDYQNGQSGPYITHKANFGRQKYKGDKASSG
jgi:hypothetical protein